MWRQSADGTVNWSNAEYRRLEAIVAEKTDAEPRRTHIFAGQLDTEGDKRRVQRAKLELPGQAEPAWFEFQLTWHGDDLMVVAMPVDRVVQAERSLSGFVQTLTQTFAHLNVGLAVFNRNRELAIFNPALTELFDLAPEFLVTRPTLFQVFDRLRDQRMVPEMKDYRAWRGKLAALEAAASDKDYSETWSLVDGRTFRVTGRPHPEGAVAFLFEDISEEIGLERKFRADVQLGHAVLDAVDEAVAVFTPSGALALSNRAYRRLWMGDAEEGDLPINFVESTRLWQHNSMPTPVWGDARDFAATMTERSNWSAEVHLSDGRALHCRFDALAGGYTLAGFADLDARAAPPLAPPKLAQTKEQQRLSA
jgi:PAS domain-containing protein